MTETEWPDSGSCWQDTEGEDGVVVVVGRTDGYVVVTGDSLQREAWVHPGFFGTRYRRKTS